MSFLDVVGALVLWLAGLWAIFAVPIIVGNVVKPLDMQGAFAGAAIGKGLAIVYVVGWAIYFIAT